MFPISMVILISFKVALMKNLKLVEEQKTTENHSVISDDEIIELFPLPKYFQIHFEHGHDNLHELNIDVAEIKCSIAQLDKKLDQLINLMSKPH